MTNRRDFLKAAGCGLALTAAAGAAPLALAQAATGKKRPNILFIMTDDHAAHAIGAYGSRINKTPGIDRLAKEGALFQDVFVTNSICTPSRACIMTGMYSCKNGVPVFNDISPKIKTVGGTLRDSGYYTALLGKWHMGGPQTVRDTDWDRWAIYQNQGQYFDPYFFTKPEKCPPNAKDHFANGRITFPGEYATDNLTRVTQGVIDEALAQGKTRPSPRASPSSSPCSTRPPTATGSPSPSTATPSASSPSPTSRPPTPSSTTTRAAPPPSAAPP